eukprot:13074712-Ditylum_brightwellii.AAC.1
MNCFFCKLHFLLVGHAEANKKHHKDHGHCTKQMRYEKCNKFLLLLCTNPKDVFEETTKDKNKKMPQKKKRWKPSKGTDKNLDAWWDTSCGTSEI